MDASNAGASDQPNEIRSKLECLSVEFIALMKKREGEEFGRLNSW